MPINTNPEPIQDPKPEIIPEAQPIKRDYDNLDQLISEMSAPKQQIGPTPSEMPGSQPGSSAPGTWQPPYQEPVTGEAAKRSGERLAKTIDSGFAFLAGLYAKSEETVKYKASEGDIQDLADPLAEISEKYNFQMSPEIRLVWLLITIYGPKSIMAANDRRINELENRIQKLEMQAQEAEIRLKQKEKEETAEVKS